MGKGTGKLAAWVAELPSGLNILEYHNLRYGRSLYFMKQIQFKLPVKSRLKQTLNLKKINLPTNTNKQVCITYFW
jgi:ribosomal protein L16/L10AE